MLKFKLSFLRLIPLVAFILGWQRLVGNDRHLAFYFGSPSRIWEYLVSKSSDGSLEIDFFTTLGETLSGFLLGNILGTCIGLSLWFSTRAFDIARPYIIALGAAPVFSLAPLMIIWFGTGLFSKIMMATLSTFFVALLQAYSGAAEVDAGHIKLMKSMNASKMVIFRKVIAPSSIVWVIAAFRINIGFALLGTFVGEYISSEKGLGHLILVATGLFDISLVLTGVLMLMIIALGLNFLMNRIQSPIKKIIVQCL